MRERGGGGRRERKKLYCNGWIHVNELKKKKKYIYKQVEYNATTIDNNKHSRTAKSMEIL